VNAAAAFAALVLFAKASVAQIQRVPRQGHLAAPADPAFEDRLLR